eukprot:2890274-Heterocapsa_arctica.AAC.2
MCKASAVGATAIRALAKKTYPGTRGAKPGKRSPDNHHVWNEAQIVRWRNQKPREQGDHDILVYFSSNQNGRHICRDCGKHCAQRRDLVKDNTCTGKPDRKGQLALETMAKTSRWRGRAS